MFFKTSNGEIDWTGKDGWYNPVKSSEGFRVSNKKSGMFRMFIQVSIVALVILLVYYLYRMYRMSRKS